MARIEITKSKCGRMLFAETNERKILLVAYADVAGKKLFDCSEALLPLETKLTFVITASERKMITNAIADFFQLMGHLKG